jgi:oxygen-independent coproporphyrinogen-3 oxidase
MHRNFMGYTTQHTEMLIGLGCSAISDAVFAYAQNEKTVEGYLSQIQTGDFAITKGFRLTSRDIRVRSIILDIACNGEAQWAADDQLLDLHAQIQLQDMQQEGLIDLFPTGLRVSQKGNTFLRNICAVFDPYLRHDSVAQQPVYSKAI